MPMECHAVHDELELFVLDELPAATRAEIEAHLGACSECRAAEEECRALLSEIKSSADEAVPTAAFEGAVRRAVAAEIGLQRRRSWARRVAAASGSMAALLLLGLAAWHVLERTGDGPESSAVELTGTSPTAHGLAQERWRYAGAAAAPTSVADGVVAQGSSMYLLRKGQGSSHVVSIHAATGALRWQSGCQSRGYLAADQSRVFCLADKGPRTLDLVALDSADGKTLWRYSQDRPHRAQGPCRAVPLSGERVCWSNQSAVHMLDAQTGTPIWTRSLAGEGLASRALASGDRLYVATGKGMHCLEVKSGREVWVKRFDREERGLGRPLLAIDDERIYFAQAGNGQTSRLVCMDLRTREFIWHRSVPWVRSLVAAGQGLYLRGHRVVALDSRSGQPLWARDAAGCGPLTLFDGLVHFVDSSSRGRLIALEQHTGRTTWEIAGLRSCDAFTKLGTTGYIKTQDGVVHAFALARLSRS